MKSLCKDIRTLLFPSLLIGVVLYGLYLGMGS